MSEATTRSVTNPFSAAIDVLSCMVGGKSRESCLSSIRLLEAAGALTQEDKEWLEHRVDLAIAEYTPIIDGMVCPGRARKDRFRALLAALPDPPKEKDK